MNTIGFKNFRRFEELSPIELSGITFFVGGNNAGKSTVVKAMMLVHENILRAQSLTRESSSIFSLGSENGKNVHVGTFGRALHKPYPDVKEIEFESKIENFTFKYVIGGDVESQRLSADIHSLEISDEEQKWSIKVDYYESKVSISCSQSVLERKSSKELRSYRLFELAQVADNENIQEMLKRLDYELNSLKQSLETMDEFRGAATRQEILRKEEQKRLLLDQWNARKTNLANDEQYSDELKFSAEDVSRCPNLFIMISELLEKKQEEAHSTFMSTSSSNTRAKSEAIIKQYDNILVWLRDIRHQIYALSYKYEMAYIPSHAVSQRVFFSREDRNDYMSDVIGRYQSSNYASGGSQKMFVQKWMKDFGIGLDFKIETIQGEAFTVTVTNMHGDDVPLADLGMGSIQIVLLLLKLATLLDDHRRARLLILVEEPEQNIHPKLQSVLAELFESVHRLYNVRFLIETHSEYLIRKTQAMIATGAVKYDENPFRVYYFPEEGEPYDMIYQESGMFENKFDEGFFDEASRQHVAVIKRARELQ